jgi:hypothetical protein
MQRSPMKQPNMLFLGGARPVHIFLPDSDFMTPRWTILQAAAQSGGFNGVEALLSAGIDPNSRTEPAKASGKLNSMALLTPRTQDGRARQVG